MHIDIIPNLEQTDDSSEHREKVLIDNLTNTYNAKLAG